MGNSADSIHFHTDEIHLTYDQNDFNFEFAALNFVNPERNQYKYKLEPYEKEWIETDASSRFAHYTNIDPENIPSVLSAPIMTESGMKKEPL